MLTDAAPARCAELLARREVDAALVPIIEYERISGVQIVPDVCVGSHESVRSVVLVSKLDELKEVRSVSLDSSSRTSQALVKIIFREYLRVDPAWETSDPNLPFMLDEKDAMLIIGDPAMRFAHSDYQIFDLASLWRSFTGFGFVFAMWMAHASAADAVASLEFARARDEGLENIDSIARQYKTALPLSAEEIRRYLTENITFHVDESLENGMRLFLELAQKHGLVERSKPLEFIKVNDAVIR